MPSAKHPKGGRIFTRGPNWYASIYVRGVEKTKRGGTKAEALTVLRQLQRERDEGKDYEP